MEQSSSYDRIGDGGGDEDDLSLSSSSLSSYLSHSTASSSYSGNDDSIISIVSTLKETDYHQKFKEDLDDHNSTSLSISKTATIPPSFATSYNLHNSSTNNNNNRSINNVYNTVKLYVNNSQTTNEISTPIPVKTVYSKSVQFIYFCVHVKTKTVMKAFVLMLDYEKQEMIISRRGKKLRSTPFVALQEPLVCPFQLNYITICTKEPNSYHLYTSSRTDRNQLSTYLNDIIKNPIECKCPMSINVLLYQGYIYKKGKVKYSQRWLQIHPLQLLLFKKKGNTYPVNVIPLQELSLKIQDDNVLLMRTKHRTFTIRSNTTSQRDFIYDQLISIGVPNRNAIILERKKSLKLTLGISPNIGYNLDFKELHKLFQNPGVDLKELHRETFEVIEEEGILENNNKDRSCESPITLTTAESLASTSIAALKNQKNTYPYYQSPRQSRRSVKDLIQQYNTKDPNNNNDNEEQDKYKTLPVSISSRKSTLQAGDRKTYRKAVRILSPSNSPPSSSANLMSNELLKMDSGSSKTWNGNGSNEVEEMYQFYTFLIDKMDVLNESCDEIINWIQSNQHLISPSHLEHLLSKRQQELGKEVKIEKEEEIQQKEPSIIKQDNNSFIQIFNNVNIEYDSPQTTTTTTSTTQIDNNIQPQQQQDISEITSLSGSDYEEEGGKDQTSTNPTLSTASIESTGYVDENDMMDDDSTDSNHARGSTEFERVHVEVYNQPQLLFNLSPMAKKQIPYNEFGDHSLVSHYHRTKDMREEDLLGKRRYSRDLIPKGVW